jgi:hypothetical protein
MGHYFYSRKRNTYIYMSARQTFMQAYFFLDKQPWKETILDMIALVYMPVSFMKP